MRKLWIALLLIGIGSNCFPAQTFRDSRIAVKLTIVDTAAVTGDGQGAYLDGQSGVTAYINNTGLWERDAIVTFGTRSFTLYLCAQQQLATNNLTPDWASTLAPLTGIQLCVKHIMYHYSARMNYSFTTRAWFEVAATVHNQVKFASAFDQAMNSLGIPPVSSQDPNDPYNTSPVRVTHYAATKKSAERWEVEPVQDLMGQNTSNPACDPNFSCASNIAVLLRVDGDGNLHNAGQWMLPFSLIIERK